MHTHSPLEAAASILRRRSLLGALAFVTVALVPSVGLAQIKQPGAHLNYSAELEPQAVVQWDGPSGFDEGLGLGFRASIPLFHNGPIAKINNNMAIGFGFHWAHFEDDCHTSYANGVIYLGSDCEANDLWFPVVLQWNFYLTPSIAVFGEPGLAIRHTRVSVDNCSNEPFVDCDYTDTDFQPFVLYMGAKFFVSDAVSVTVRLGFPTISVGASFFL